MCPTSPTASSSTRPTSCRSRRPAISSRRSTASCGRPRTRRTSGAWASSTSHGKSVSLLLSYRLLLSFLCNRALLRRLDLDLPLNRDLLSPSPPSPASPRSSSSASDARCAHRAAWDFPAGVVAPSPVLERLGLYKPDEQPVEPVSGLGASPLSLPLARRDARLTRHLALQSLRERASSTAGTDRCMATLSFRRAFRWAGSRSRRTTRLRRERCL